MGDDKTLCSNVLCNLEASHDMHHVMEIPSTLVISQFGTWDLLPNALPWRCLPVIREIFGHNQLRS